MKKYLFIVLAIISAMNASAQLGRYFGKVQQPPKKCGAMVSNLLTHGVDTSDSRGVADNYYLWKNGATITVKFMPGGSERLRNLVKQYAKEWEQYANLKFDFVPDNTPNTNIRVKLWDADGHYSVVGTMANVVSQNRLTLNLDTTDFIDWDYYVKQLQDKGTDLSKYTEQQLADLEKQIKNTPNVQLRAAIMKGTTMHEFGHAIGLLHEQSYPGGIKWKKTDEVYDYYKKTQGWSKEDVDAQVFMVSDVFYTNGTSYDPKSIMQYSIDAWQTEDGFSVPRNNELSAGDKNLISVLYPKGKAVSDREVPRVEVKNMTNLDVYSNDLRKGLVIYPKFDISTNSKLGNVYYVARLVDEKGYYIKDTDSSYNWGGAVATFVKANLLPNSSVSFNSGSQKNLELFLPYSQIPALNGKKVSIEFTVILDDKVNGQFDKLMYYAYTGFLSLPK